MKHLRILTIALGAGALLLGGTAQSLADFTGQTVTAEWRYPDFGSILETHDVVVGGGVELPPDVIINDSKFGIDIGADFVSFDFNALSNWTATSFNGWRFADTNGTIPEIIDYSIDSFSGGIAGLTDDDLGFDADSVWGNFAGVTVAGGGEYIQLKVSFVPEPASLALLALGGLAALRRR
ncbi:MAG: PEP-CTERM sorting domain-containing protein [Planctomycetes bacterium]|nr:PEP-CTERM sorting domain-containing protein [Planctomycetota bacterium]